MFLIWTHLLVEQTVHDEEEGALLGVEQDEEHLEEEVGLVQTQDPSAAQDDRLGQDLEHDQPAETFKRGTAKRIRDRAPPLDRPRYCTLIGWNSSS